MTLPAILQHGRTPEAWAAELAANDIMVSARTIRELARRKGAYRIAGRAMILLPEHIDTIFEEAKPCSNPSNAGASGMRSGASNTTGVRSANTTDAVADAGGWADPTMLDEVYTHAEGVSGKILTAFRTGLAQAESETGLKLLKTGS